ncbi:MAG: ABC transporter permease [Sulfurospirillaceae bacterium]|nr:ABC transporter permease [Sulfurospirillaceae bacterium]MDD3462538.1 ABC transporter permease [Sulfurospirillaceae bacterium]
MNSQKNLYMSRLRGVFSLLVFIGIWECSVRFGWVPFKVYFPPFSQVALDIKEMLFENLLIQSYKSSLVRVLFGFIIGATSGIALGVWMGWSEKVYDFLKPIVSILYPIPALGWLPLLMLLIGINEVLPVVIIFICSFFPIVYNTVTGIQEVKKEYINAAKLLGAGDFTILRKIVIPQALPYIFIGLKLESGAAWRTVVAAEMIAIPTGIGALMMRAENLMRIDIILVCLIVLSLMCLIFEGFFSYLERKMTAKWN